MLAHNARIKVFAIPKRSPDLSAMEYAVWKHLNSLMRRQEKCFPKGKKETRTDFIARLQRTAGWPCWFCRPAPVWPNPSSGPVRPGRARPAWPPGQAGPVWPDN